MRTTEQSDVNVWIGHYFGGLSPSAKSRRNDVGVKQPLLDRQPLCLNLRMLRDRAAIVQGEAMKLGILASVLNAFMREPKKFVDVMEPLLQWTREFSYC